MKGEFFPRELPATALARLALAMDRRPNGPTLHSQNLSSMAKLHRNRLRAVGRAFAPQFGFGVVHATLFLCRTARIFEDSKVSEMWTRPMSSRKFAAGLNLNPP